MPRLLGLPAVLVALVVLVAGVDSPGPRTPAPTPGRSDRRRRARDRDTGFAIVHYDGRVDHPPTLSRAGPSAGYARRVERVRCRTALRVWYRELGRLKRALEYAHSLR